MKRPSHSFQKTLGVLGGGQLALYLSLKAKALGWKLLTLSPSHKDPTALKVKSLERGALRNKAWIQGDPHTKKDLKSFLSQVDILTFESEFFSAKLIKECKKKTKIHPSLKNLACIQDRLLQKKLLAKHHFSILPFKAWSNNKIARSQINQAHWLQHKAFSKDKELKLNNKFNSEEKLKAHSFEKLKKRALLKIWEDWGPFVLKTRQGGYDGYGTFVIKTKPELFKLLDSFSQTAFQSADKTESSSKKRKKNLPETSFIAEPLLKFKRELAILSARNQKGQVVFFPLVESFQENSVCLWVKGPVEHPKLAGLKRKISLFLKKIDYRGVIAFELFETEEGLIVNELAPRVHNTGHYSLTALTEDQFTLHLKAVSNQDLKSPRLLAEEFAMLNLLGEGSPTPLIQKKDKAFSLIEQTDFLKEKGFDLYWYGKNPSRPGRKMGHINRLGKGSLTKLLKLKKQLKV